MKKKYVTFEQAKLLQEKGFDVVEYLKIDDENPLNLNSNYNPREYQPWYLDLPQYEIVDWLLENHKLWVSVHPNNNNTWSNLVEDVSDKGWTRSNGTRRSIPRDNGINVLKQYSNPQEAYSAAITYCLKEII